MDSPWYQLHKSTWDPIKIYISITTHLPLQLKVILILSVVHIRVMYNKLPINTIKLAMLSKIDKITRIFFSWIHTFRGIARKFLMVGQDLEFIYTHKKHAHVYVRHY